MKHLFETLYFSPIAITHSGFFALHQVLSRRASLLEAKPLRPVAEDAEDEDVTNAFGFDGFVNARRPMKLENGIAHIHLLGPIGKNLSLIERACGATGIEQLRNDFDKAIASGAKGIFLDVDSPGGSNAGLPELATHIQSIARTVPVVAYTEDVMASAAYWLSAGCTAIYATPSAQVGCIGVYIGWIEFIEQMHLQGLHPAPIIDAAAPLKAIGFTGTLTPEHRAYLQATVDGLGNDFREWVLSNRAVSPEAMLGQCLSGAAAVSAGLSELVQTRAEALEKLNTLVTQKAQVTTQPINTNPQQTMFGNTEKKILASLKTHYAEQPTKLAEAILLMHEEAHAKSTADEIIAAVEQKHLSEALTRELTASETLRTQVATLTAERDAALAAVATLTTERDTARKELSNGLPAPIATGGVSHSLTPAAESLSLKEFQALKPEKQSTFISKGGQIIE